MKYSNSILANSLIASVNDPIAVIRRKAEATERQRILKQIHDQVSPKLLAAVFAAQMALEKLGEKDSAASEQVANASATVIEAIDRLVEIFDPEMSSINDASTAA